MTTSERFSERLADAVAAPNPARFRVLLREVRFWVIQVLMLVVTTFHGILEWVGDDDLVGFAHGIQYLPVELYVLPIVLAAYWYGMEGALMTGLMASLLSIPNLMLFHRPDYEWVGEAASNTIVLGLGLLVGLMVERVQVARALAESRSRDLRVLQQVAAVLNRHETPDDLIQAVVEVLAGAPGAEGAAFIPVEGSTERLHAAGGDGSLSSPGDPSVAVVVVDVEGAIVGRLAVRVGSETRAAREEELLRHVVQELALALEHSYIRRRAHADLQGYARAVTEAQEQERRRIARDLHDGPAQSLVVLTRGVNRLTGGDGIEELRGLARRTLDAIRGTIWTLRPSVLDDLGLLPALQSLVETAGADGSVSLESTGVPSRLDGGVEIAAYRIAQEAIANAVRHSDAERIHVTLDFHKPGLSLRVEDDGTGFDEAALDRSRSFGLMGMKERADLAGGSLQVRSGLGVGTTVDFQVTS